MFLKSFVSCSGLTVWAALERLSIKFSMPLLGLEWKHIDWKAGIIDVQQNVPKTKSGKALVKEPKNKSSIRRLALPPSVLEELRNYYTYRVKERNTIGDDWQGGEHFFVFAHADGRAFTAERPYSWFQSFAERQGIRNIRFHDLRHTSATMLLNAGVHAKVISERLGHSSILTTMNTYSHVLRSADQAAADKFENLFSLKTNTK
jgi:integrase